MHMNRKILGLLALLLLMVFSEACRTPRCPIDSCHIRMRHRHPSFSSGGSGNSGESVTMVDVNASPEANLGKVYRGVPWWERNKDPKIAYKYNPKFKYKHKDTKPWSARILKYKSKRAKKIADDERKAAKKGGNSETPAEGEGTENPEEGDNGMPPQPDMKNLSSEESIKEGESSEMTNTSSKKSKKAKKSKEKKPKEPKKPKEKKPKEKKSKKEETPKEEEKEDDGF